MKHYVITTYGCKEWLCRTGRIPGVLEIREIDRRLTMADIKAAVSARFKIPLHEMVSDRRAREVARPRQVSMYLCKQLTHRSLPEIGRHHGDRDHTTVIHAVRQIERFRAEDPELDYIIKDLVATLDRHRVVGEARA